MSGDLHIVPNQAGAWEVRENGELNPISTFDNERLAVDFARAVARHLQCPCALHRADGTIEYVDANGT